MASVPDPWRGAERGLRRGDRLRAQPPRVELTPTAAVSAAACGWRIAGCRVTCHGLAGEAAGQGLHGARGPGAGARAGAVGQVVPVDRPGARDTAPHAWGGEQADDR